MTARCPACGTPLDGGPVLYRCQPCGAAVWAADLDRDFHPPASTRRAAWKSGWSTASPTAPCSSPTLSPTLSPRAAP
jgi:hypothetical protein